MASTTLSLVDPGRHTLALRAERLCESNLVTVSNGAYWLFSINWYQRNYPYVWAGARLVRDL